MPQYTPTLLSNNTAIDADLINTELQAIQTAHNSHATGDFGATCVPQTALVSGNAPFFDTIFIASVVGAKTTADIIAYIVVPFTCTLKNVRYIADTLGDAISTIAIYKNGVLNQTATTLAAADTGYSVTSFTSSSFVAGDIISIRCVVAGGVTHTNVSATLAFYAAHCATTLP